MISFVLIVNKKIDVSQCLSNAKIWNYIYITKHFVIFLLNNELYLIKRGKITEINQWSFLVKICNICVWFYFT